MPGAADAGGYGLMGMTGQKAHIARLKKLQGPEAVKLIGAALFAAGEVVKAEAQRSISAGSVSGKGHVPSNPGEPPNFDTGVLSRNIEVSRTGRLEVTVGSYAPYAGGLEFGTSKIEARPYMVPARNKTRKEIRALVTEAVKVAARRSG
jgi:HK97 gp10 family phage protein